MEQKQLSLEKINEEIIALKQDMIKMKAILEKEQDKNLKQEMKMWEEAGAEDGADFFEKHNL